MRGLKITAAKLLGAHGLTADASLETELDRQLMSWEPGDHVSSENLVERGDDDEGFIFLIMAAAHKHLPTKTELGIGIYHSVYKYIYMFVFLNSSTYMSINTLVAETTTDRSSSPIINHDPWRREARDYEIASFDTLS